MVEWWKEAALLDTLRGLHDDSKAAVDMPLALTPEEMLTRLDALRHTSPTLDERAAFAQATFLRLGADLVNATPPDHSTDPPILSSLPDGPVRKWAASLNELFKPLCREPSDYARRHPERCTLLAVPHPFFVPGGRFREAYYWDSYWIVLGLLACGMRTSARRTVENLLFLVSEYGFVPNGLRRYYLNRSQPPMLAQMVRELAERGAGSDAEEAEILRSALPLLDREYAWWMSGERAVQLDHGCVLNRYCVSTDEPRPESWREDINAAAHLPEEERAALYAELAAAAESGWDFSSRWLRRDEPESPNMAAEKTALREVRLGSMRTSKILAVDLNAIMHRNELTLASLHQRLASLEASAGGSIRHEDIEAMRESAAAYRHAANARDAAIRSYLWDSQRGAWLDYDLVERAHTRVISAASYTPLWACACSAAEARAAVASLAASSLVQRGGVAATTIRSGEQWDYPNAWPPLQQMVIEGLKTCGAPGGETLARRLALCWLRSCHIAWCARGAMDEKQDVTALGQRGNGGEYEPQDGFGWTNGAVLHLLRDYGDDFAAYISPSLHPSPAPPTFSARPCGRRPRGPQQPPGHAQVVIIGGGLAGLSAAAELEAAGLDWLIIEADGWLGGRVRTMSTRFGMLEEGAQWIHGSADANPVMALARDAGLPSRVDPRSCSSGSGADDAIRAARERLLRALDDAENWARDRDHDEICAIRDDVSVAEALRVCGWKATSAVDRAVEAFELDFGLGDSAATASAHHNEYTTVDFGEEEQILCGEDRGASSLIAVLSDRLPSSKLVLGTQVVACAQRKGAPMEVRWTQPHSPGREALHGCILCEHAICTASVAALRAIRIEPRLPGAMLSALSSIGMCAYVKVFLAFDDDDSLANVYSAEYHLSKRAPFHVWQRLASSNGLVLVGTAMGEGARRCEALLAAELFDEACLSLRALWPLAPPPVAMHSTNWGSDPLFGGAYSILPPNSLPMGFDALTAPHGQLWLAGEAFHPRYSGFMHGALLSGRAQARAVIGCIHGDVDGADGGEGSDDEAVSEPSPVRSSDDEGLQ